MLKKLVKYIRDSLTSSSKKAAKTPQTDTLQTQHNKQAATQTQDRATTAEKKTPKNTGDAKYRKPKPPPKPKKAWDISKFKVVEEEGKSRFHDFNLPTCLMHAIADLDFKYCTPVQAKTMEHTLSGSDAIGQAQTGTGKTAAFIVTAITTLAKNKQKNKKKNGRPRALVIAPTRELVMQIAKDGKVLGKYCNITFASVFGGMDYEKQQQALEKRPVDILVATPGRLLDFQRRRIVDLSQVEIMIIDEADRMLDMGFIPDVRKIVNSTRSKDKRQTLLFSATMTEDVKRLASQWCNNPIHVVIEPDSVAVDTVEQIVYLTTASERYSLLYNIITSQNLTRVLVFTNRKDETRKLTERLKRNNISCDMLSGDVAQKKRMTTLERFRDGKIKILVATDVAGRGIHIDGVSHVFNYTLPYEPEDYVHRIGRTGRAGNEGTAISFADEEGAFYLPEIEEYISRKLECIYPDESLVKPAPKGTAPPVKKGAKSHKSGSYKGKKRPHSQQGRRKTGPYRGKSDKKYSKAHKTNSSAAK